MLDALHFMRYPQGFRDRRARVRQHLPSLFYLNLDDLTEGVVANLTEDGLALAAPTALPSNPLVHFRIYFQGSTDWIETSGYIAWKSTSGKTGGIRFTDLTDNARQRVRTWLSEKTPIDSPPPTSDPQQNQKSRDNATDRAVLGPAVDCTTHGVVGTHSISNGRTAEWEKESGITTSRVSFDNASDSANVAANSYPSGERRSCPRTRIVPLGYIQLGDANGGIALNISEVGMAITAAMILSEEHIPSMKVQFPDSSEWIETSGRITWQSESRKEAGVHFVGLSEVARLQIRNWIASQSVPTDIQLPRYLIHQNQQGRSEDLESEVKEDLTTATLAPDWNAREQEGVSLTDSSPLNDRPVQLFNTDALIAKPEQKRLVVRPRWENRIQPHTRSGVSHPRWVAFAILAALIGFVSLVPSGTAFFSSWQKRITGEVRHKTQDLSEVLKTKHPITATKTSPIPEPNTKGGVPQVLEPEPLVHTQIKMHEPAGQPDLQAESVKLAPVPVMKTPIRESPIHVVEEVRSKRQIPVQAQNDDAKAPPSLGDSLPANKSEMSAKLAALVSSTSRRPSAPLPPDVKNEGSSSQRKSPTTVPAQPVLKNVGSVSVSTNPYPAIRVTGETGIKKSRHVTSLQLGHLISRVDPIYPDDAIQEGVEGTVTAHAIVARDGVVESVTSISGPPRLTKVVLNAVRQWRYSQTLVAGQPVETEEDIAVTFRLSNSVPDKR